MNRARDALTWLPSESGGPAWFPRVDRFRIDDVEFHCSFEQGSEPNLFYIRKHRPLVEDYLAVFNRFQAANVVELGIMEGGSVALAALAARPRKMVAFELEPERVEALDALIAGHRLDQTVRPYYGVDQSDRGRAWVRSSLMSSATRSSTWSSTTPRIALSQRGLRLRRCFRGCATAAST